MNSERTLYLHVHVDAWNQTYQTSCGPNYVLKYAKEEILAHCKELVPVLYQVQFFRHDDQLQQHPISHLEKWSAEIHDGGSDDSPIIVWIRNLVTDFVGRLENRNCPDVMGLYDATAEFTEIDQHWVRQLPLSRFGKQGKSILYRPEIVNRLVTELNDLLTATSPVGIIVQGLQGVGKSHSLVNLVRRLRFGENERQQYHVTFVPDCERFEDFHFVYNAICRSFGTDMDHMAVEPIQDWASFCQFISKVSTSLTACGKIWVFIFDQINKIFSRERNKNVSDLGDLPFPEKLIKGVLEAGKIVSIVSASANNQAVLSHDGFISFLHDRQMSPDELRATFPSLANTNADEFEAHCETTDRVPLQMSQLIAAAFSKESYDEQAKGKVILSLKKLHAENSSEVKEITNSALSCILRNAMGSVLFYDRKHLVRDQESRGIQYRAAFPAVLLAYHEYYFDNIIANLDEILANIARTWMMPDISQAERGWIFERAVIASCKQNGTITCTNGDMSLPRRLTVSFQKGFPGQGLPTRSNLTKDGMYVPVNSNFPAIDFIWKQKNKVVAVQAHVNRNHKLVRARFEQMMTDERSWGGFGKVYLLYLSPDKATARKMRVRVTNDTTSGDHPNLEVLVASVSDFTHLSEILQNTQS